MLNIIKSEHLKMKGVGKFVISFPIITVIFAILFGGFGILAPFSIYWWETLFCPMLFVIMVMHDYKKEEKAGAYINIKTLSISKAKIFVAKIFNIIVYVLVSGLLLSVLVYILQFISVRTYSVDRLILGNIAIVLSLSIMIPIIFCLAEYINVWILLIIDSVFYLMLVPIISMNKFYYLVPFSYTFKISHYLLNIVPTGEVGVNNGIVNINGISILLFIAVFLSVIFSIFFSKFYMRRKK